MKKVHTVKFLLGTLRNCYNLVKIHTKRFYHREKLLKFADGMTNSVDPDQTAPLRAVSDCCSTSNQIWVYIDCPYLDVQKLRIITVYVGHFE